MQQRWGQPLLTKAPVCVFKRGGGNVSAENSCNPVSRPKDMSPEIMMISTDSQRERSKRDQRKNHLRYRRLMVTASGGCKIGKCSPEGETRKEKKIITASDKKQFRKRRVKKSNYSTGRRGDKPGHGYSADDSSGGEERKGRETRFHPKLTVGRSVRAITSNPIKIKPCGRVFLCDYHSTVLSLGRELRKIESVQNLPPNKSQTKKKRGGGRSE